MTSSVDRHIRLSEIERIKGFLIILVVWGHVYDPALPDWALAIRHGIYAFHMPAFMFLSGYLFVYVGAHVVNSNYLTYVLRRAKRLLLPFCVMAVVVIVGKSLFQTVMVVHKPISDLPSSLLNIVFHTERSPVLFIWYLFVLFVISILVPILVQGKRRRLILVGIAALFLHIAHVEMANAGIILDFLYLDRIIMYFVFFAFGALACAYRDRWNAFVDTSWVPAFPLFIAFEYITWNNEWRYLVVGSAAIVFLHGIARTDAKGQLSLLEFFGKYAMAIYLFNLAFIGVTLGVFAKILSPTDGAIGLIITATCLGVFGPMLMKYVLSLVRPLRSLSVAID